MSRSKKGMLQRFDFVQASTNVELSAPEIEISYMQILKSIFKNNLSVAVKTSLNP